MKRIGLILLGLISLFIFTTPFYLNAQYHDRDNLSRVTFDNLAKEIKDIKTELKKLGSEIDEMKKEIKGQLQQILSGQAAISEELKKIRMRVN